MALKREAPRARAPGRGCDDRWLDEMGLRPGAAPVEGLEVVDAQAPVVVGAPPRVSEGFVGRLEGSDRFSGLPALPVGGSVVWAVRRRPHSECLADLGRRGIR